MKPQETKQNSHLEYIDILAVLSCLAVVFLHSNGIFWSFEKSRWWVYANVIESVFYFAFPFFFMLAGATLLDYRKRYSTEEFFAKRINKTVIPIVFWSILGIVFNYLMGSVDVGIFTPLNIIDSIINTKANGETYWVFICLYTTYLAIPVLTLIPGEQRKGAFSYIILGFIILNVTLPLISSLSNYVIPWNIGVIMPIGANFVIYVLIGYYIDKYEIKKSTRILIYVLGFLALLLHMLGTLYLSFRDNALNETFKGHMGLACIVYSSAIFLFFRNLKDSKFKTLLYNVASLFRKQTFGIYLIHYFIIATIRKFITFNDFNFKYRILLALVTFLTSWIIVKLAQKMPILKKLLS